MTLTGFGRSPVRHHDWRTGMRFVDFDLLFRLRVGPGNGDEERISWNYYVRLRERNQGKLGGSVVSVLLPHVDGLVVVLETPRLSPRSEHKDVHEVMTNVYKIFQTY